MTRTLIANHLVVEAFYAIEAAKKRAADATAADAAEIAATDERKAA